MCVCECARARACVCVCVCVIYQSYYVVKHNQPTKQPNNGELFVLIWCFIGTMLFCIENRFRCGFKFSESQFNRLNKSHQENFEALGLQKIDKQWNTFFYISQPCLLDNFLKCGQSKQWG